jgi:hypothetical protein
LSLTRKDATATLNFYGTACYYFGAKRSNHGQYTVSLDKNATQSDGYEPDPGQFQQLLYSAENLELANHTLTITNGPVNGLWVDVDYIVFTTGDGYVNSFREYFVL